MCVDNTAICSQANFFYEQIYNSYSWLSLIKCLGIACGIGIASGIPNVNYKTYYNDMCMSQHAVTVEGKKVNANCNVSMSEMNMLTIYQPQFTEC